MSSPSKTSLSPFTQDVKWVDSSSCQGCNYSSWMPWKHHCRACGGCFCQNCSSKTLALPPKHPLPVRVCDKCYDRYTRRYSVPLEPEKTTEAITLPSAGGAGSRSASFLSASLPADYFTRGRIDEYSGSGPRVDPLSASVAVSADSPTAKWLTDRTVSSYYATPPSPAPPEPAIEANEEEKEEKKEERRTKEENAEQKDEQSEKDESFIPAPSAVGTHEANNSGVNQEPNGEQEKKCEIDEGEREGEGGEEKRMGDQAPETEEGQHVKDVDYDQKPEVTTDEREESSSTTTADVETSAHIAQTETREDVTLNTADGEDGALDEKKQSKIDGAEERESAPTDQPPIDESGSRGTAPTESAVDVNTKHSESEESTETTLSSEESRRPAEPEENEVIQLKEKIKKTEEEDKAETEKREAIQHKVQSMDIASLKEHLELCNLAAKELSSSIFYGLRDSLRIGYATISIKKSHRVYNHIKDTLILNGPLLLCMYILFKYIFEPHFHSMLHWKEHRGFTLVFVHIMEFLLRSSFLALWVGPIYILSLVLNMQWSQEVGNGAFSLYLYIRRGKTLTKTSKPLSDTIAQMIYWQIIFGVFNLLNFLCKFVPIVGPPFYFLCLCWLNAVYCFDLKWGNQKWSLHKKISYCETRWLYFIGFGIPITLATFFFEYVISYSLVSLLFPLFIPMAMYGSPKTQSLWKPIPMSRFLDSSIISPLLHFIFTVPSQVEKLEEKMDTILRFLFIAVCSSIGLGVVAYLAIYLFC